jgi:hypothetical protein
MAAPARRAIATTCCRYVAFTISYPVPDLKVYDHRNASISLDPTAGNTLPAQPIDATQALNLSAGVSKFNVFRGRSFNCLATLFNSACEYTDKSVPLG